MLSNESCQKDLELITSLDPYFRDEPIIPDAKYASKELGYIIFCTYMIVIVFGAIGNFLTIAVVIVNPSMRTTRNFFILNLALADFFTCTVTAPMTLYTIMYTYWPFGTAMCKITGSTQGITVFLSSFSITAIALDRYVLVIFPTNRQRQRNLALIFFLAIWVSSIVLAIPLLIASDIDIPHEDPICEIVIKMCGEQNYIWDKMPISKQTYTLSVLGIQYAFPLCSLVFVYSRIAHRMKMRFVNRHSSSSHTSESCNVRRKSVVERQRRTHLLLICVVSVFGIAWLPLNIFHIVNTLIQEAYGYMLPVPAFAFCHILAMCSSALNPMFYAFFNQNFRSEFIRLLDQIGLRTLRICLFGDKEVVKSTLKTELTPRTVRLSLPLPKSASTRFPSMNTCSQNIILQKHTEDLARLTADLENIPQPGDMYL